MKAIDLQGMIKYYDIETKEDAWIEFQKTDPLGFERKYLWKIYTNLRDGRNANDSTRKQIFPLDTTELCED